MLRALRGELKTVLVAVVAAAVTAGAPAIAHGVHAAFAHDADKVDGKHAVGSSASTTKAKGKLVATASNGKFAAKFIPKVAAAVNADKLGNVLASQYRRKYKGVLAVAKSGGDFTTVQAAVNSITDATAPAPYLVYVAPGTYAEVVTMKPNVDLQGAGPGLTRIESDGLGVDALVMNAGRVRDLTVHHLGNPDNNGAIWGTDLDLERVDIQIDGGGNPVGAVMGFSTVKLDDVEIEIIGGSSTPYVSTSQLRADDSEFRGSSSIFVSNLATVTDSKLEGTLEVPPLSRIRNVEMTGLQVIGGLMHLPVHVSHSVIKTSLVLFDNAEAEIAGTEVPDATNITIGGGATLECVQSWDTNWVEVPQSCIPV